MKTSGCWLGSSEVRFLLSVNQVLSWPASGIHQINKTGFSCHEKVQPSRHRALTRIVLHLTETGAEQLKEQQGYLM